MSMYGRLSKSVQDTAGNAVSGASVTVYSQGGTVNGSASGASPLAVTVYHAGAIPTSGSPTVEVWDAAGTTRRAASDATTSFTAGTVGETSVTLSGFTGTLSITANDRLVLTSNQPTLYADTAAAVSKSNPLTTDANGFAFAWARGNFYDTKVSGTGLTTKIFYDQYVPAQDNEGNWFTGGTESGWVINALRTLGASDILIAGKNAGTNVFRVFGTGAWRSAGGGTIDTGGLTVSASGITVTGNSTITGTLTSLTGITSSGTASLATVNISGATTHSGVVYASSLLSADNVLSFGGIQSVASAGAFTVPTSGSCVWLNVTGTTPITSFSNAAYPYRLVVLKFATGAANMVVDGSNLIMDGNFGPTANSIIAFIGDDSSPTTQWYELFRKHPTGIAANVNADATPSVLGVEKMVITNSGGTTVTSFTNGTTGQIVRVRFADGNTTLNETGNIVLSPAQGASFNFAAGDTIIMQYDGTSWRMYPNYTGV